MLYRKIIFSCWLLCAMNTANATPQIEAKSVSVNSHFPTPAATIQQWIAKNNHRAIRSHAWHVWASVNAPSGEFYHDNELPLWETWYDSDEVFALPTRTLDAKQFLATHRKALHHFQPPHQFALLRNSPMAFDTSHHRVMSFIKFNPDAAAFIMTPHAGGDGKDYSYSNNKNLVAINDNWPKDTPIEKRGIESFPARAIETKEAFEVVKATGLTPVPVWQGAAASTMPELPTPRTWTTCVLIDPKGKTHRARPATTAEIAHANKTALPCKKYFYASLSMIYAIKLDAQEALQFHDMSGAVQEGDFAVLLGMHINTHETPLWTWQTFYWQPEGLEDAAQFPGSKQGQPSTLASPWNQYVMATAYNQTRTAAGQEMTVCFNPYFEIGLPAGMQSNCMSCHAVARVTTNPQAMFFPLEYKKPIKFPDDPMFFDNMTTHTEFSWAVAAGV